MGRRVAPTPHVSIGGRESRSWRLEKRGRRVVHERGEAYLGLRGWWALAVVLAAGTRELTEGGFDVAVLAVGAKMADVFRESGLASGDDDACG
ncbi:MAG TPA: hypothetical protein VK357_01630 [Rubrobacteraceae bacterium]|nr:hypothetical protein [Rubrobacteraceae bacterium]